MDNTHYAKKKFSFYDNFDGHYHKIGEISALIPQFKTFYYTEKRKDLERSAIKIINDFNKQISPLTFFPWEKQYRLWRKKWDAELLAEQGYKQEQQKTHQQLIKPTNKQGEFIIPSEHSLEAGAHILAGELLNDAITILKSDQNDDEVYDEDIIVKRRNYVLNVFNYVIKAAHSKESLNLKSNAEKRETASFIVDLLKRSTAGKITPEEINLLKQSITRAEN